MRQQRQTDRQTEKRDRGGIIKSETAETDRQTDRQKREIEGGV